MHTRLVLRDYLPSLLYKSLFIFQPFFVLSESTLACDTASGISQCLVFYALVLQTKLKASSRLIPKGSSTSSPGLFP